MPLSSAQANIITTTGDLPINDHAALPSILHVQPTSQDGQYDFTVSPDHCVGPPGNVFLFGGAGLASAVAALEHHSKRRLICATAQYSSYARPGDQLSITTHVSAHGKQTSQMHARISKGDEDIILVTAALGDRDNWPEHQWAQVPDMLPPEQCEEWPLWPNQAGGLLERIEVKLEPGEIARLRRDGTVQPHGRLRYWLRPRGAVAIDTAFLAIAADFVPSGAAAAFGRLGGGNSLDNGLRIGTIVPTSWLMCEVDIDFALRGFAHGTIKIFAQSGHLLATGSQSLVLRFMDA